MRTAFQFQVENIRQGNRQQSNQQQQQSQNPFQFQHSRQQQSQINQNRNIFPSSTTNNNQNGVRQQSLRNNFFEENFGPNRNNRDKVECTFCGKKMTEIQLTAHWNSQCNMGRQQRRNQDQLDEYENDFDDDDNYLGGLQNRFQQFRITRNSNQQAQNRSNNNRNVPQSQNINNIGRNLNRNTTASNNSNSRQLVRNFSIRRVGNQNQNNTNTNNNANQLRNGNEQIFRSPQQQQRQHQVLLNELINDYRNYDLERNWDILNDSNSSDSDSPERLLSPPRESLLQRQFRIRQQKMKEKQEKKKIVQKIYKTVKITGELSKKFKKEEVDCAICLSGFEKLQTQAEMPCKHKFHKNCIDDWLIQKQECPLCKRKYPTTK